MARAIYKVLGGKNYKNLGYMRGNPNEEKIRTLVTQLRNLGVSIQHKDHEIICTTRKVKVDKNTGEIIEDVITA